MVEFSQPELSKLTIVVATKPTDLVKLNMIYNKFQLNNVMLGSMIWDIINANYQLEIIGEEESFKKGMEYDRSKLWHYIQMTVNPSTTTGTSGFNGEIELKTLR